MYTVCNWVTRWLYNVICNWMVLTRSYPLRRDSNRVHPRGRHKELPWLMESGDHDIGLTTSCTYIYIYYIYIIIYIGHSKLKIAEQMMQTHCPSLVVDWEAHPSITTVHCLNSLTCFSSISAYLKTSYKTLLLYQVRDTGFKIYWLLRNIWPRWSNLLSYHRYMLIIFMSEAVNGQEAAGHPFFSWRPMAIYDCRHLRMRNMAELWTPKRHPKGIPNFKHNDSTDLDRSFNKSWTCDLELDSWPKR